MLRTDRRLWLVALLLVAGLQLSACGDGSTDSDSDPAQLEPIKGTSLNRVTLTGKAAERLGIETAPVRVERIAGKRRKVIPYAAVLYTPGGHTFAYQSPEHLVFVRQPIRVGRIKGDWAVLSRGPPSGTAVVTVGAQELFGVEYEVEED